MRPVSAQFLDAVRADHKVIIRVDVLSYGTFVQSLPVIGGSVTLDRSAAIRGRCELTIADMVPATADAVLAPYGNEVAVYRGIEFGTGTAAIPSTPGTSSVGNFIWEDGSIALAEDGSDLLPEDGVSGTAGSAGTAGSTVTQEWIRLGIFGIDSAESVEPGRTVRIIGQDRAEAVSRARLEAPYKQAAGVNYATAIAAFLAGRIPWAPFQLTFPNYVTPLVVVQEQADPWQTAQGWAQAYGHELYFDGDGIGVSRAEPDIGHGPIVFDIDEGAAGVLIDAATSWDRTGMYNRVIATGSNPASTGIYRGVATDVDPSSPTAYGGKFGRVPFFFDSPLISSAAMAQASADSILRRVTGQTQAVRFDSVVLPFLEPGDIINVIRSTLPINETPHLIETLTIPLGADGRMSGTTRTRRSM